ncbi:MAG: hypothetical protein ACI8UO_000569 [Verrucomicrobiales bacterium]|jgi:hypothetical protein
MAGSDYRLFLEIEVSEFVRSRKRREQEQLLSKFREIAAFPTAHVDYFKSDQIGRQLGVHVSGTFAIKFWEDVADQHLKIIEITPADRAG